MKNLIWLLMFGLVAVGVTQMVSGTIHRHEFEVKLHEVALRVADQNQDEIKQQVIAEGKKLHLQVLPSAVNVQYAPTSDLNFAQRMVSRIGTFQNHRATIAVDFTQSILFVSRKHHAEGTALIESAATPKRAEKMPE